MAGNPGGAAVVVENEPEPDDGLTPEERVQFEEMRSADPPPGADTGAADGAGADAGADEAAAVAAAAAAAAAAVPGEDDGDDEGDDEVTAGGAPGGRKVRRPRVALKRLQDAEREAADLRGELAKRNETYARADERLRILSEALAPKVGPDGKPLAVAGEKEVEEDAEPELDANGDPVDIFAHNKWLKRQMQRLDGRISEFQTGTAERDADMELATSYEADAREFAATEPNFVPAYQFLMDSRTMELAQYYFGKDVARDAGGVYRDDKGVALTRAEIGKIKQTIMGEEKTIARETIETRKTNPDAPSAAIRMFRLAKSRGFKPAAPVAAAAAAGANGAGKPAVAANGAGKPAGAAAVIPGSLALDPGAGGAGGAQPKVADEIARIKAGQETAISLSDGGGAPLTPLTAVDLANMPQDQFERMVETMTDAQWKQLNGG